MGDTGFDGLPCRDALLAFVFTDVAVEERESDLLEPSVFFLVSLALIEPNMLFF